MKTKQANNIDEYIADFPDDARAAMEKVRTAIKKAAPRAEEAIKYQIPTFVLNGNLIHFGGYKNHVGLYPGSKAIEEFREQLMGYKVSKGTVQLPLDKPMPVGLINKITKFCVQRNLAKPQKRAKAQK